MPLNPHRLIPIGAALGCLSVILGAFGAHALKGHIGYDLFDIYQTASHYLTIHSIALVLYGLWVKSTNTQKIWPAYSFLAGILIFCGTLYGITFTAIRALGAITPIGGLLLIVGWLGFAVQAGRSKA